MQIQNIKYTLECLVFGCFDGDHINSHETVFGLHDGLFAMAKTKITYNMPLRKQAFIHSPNITKVVFGVDDG